LASTTRNLRGFSAGPDAAKLVAVIFKPADIDLPVTAVYVFNLCARQGMDKIFPGKGEVHGRRFS